MRNVFNKFILFIFLFLNPLIIKAYGIENYYINAELQSNGDLVVQEYFELNGTYNGFERIIKYADNSVHEFDKNSDYYGPSLLYNGDDIVLNEIRAVYKSSNFDFNNVFGTIFRKTFYASKGDFGVYSTKYVTDGKSYLIYLPNSYNKAFYLKYTLKNMGILHNDVGELWWEVFGDELTESVGHLEIKVSFPNNKNEFRVWAHGPLNGDVSKNGQNILFATIDDLSPYDSIDVRAVFDKEVLDDCKKQTGVLALDKILNYELDAANKANSERDQYEKSLQKQLIQEYNYCLESPNRSCYENANNLLNNITDDTFYDEYYDKLENLKKIIVFQEEEAARNATDLAVRYKEYMWYEDAIGKVAILENSVLKTELENKLNLVLEEIKVNERRREYINLCISLGMIIGIILLYRYMVKQHKNKYAYLFNQEYLRDFPDNSTPSQVSYLFHKKITNDAVSAEILNLINKKAIVYKKNDNEKNDYFLKINNDYVGSLSHKEKILLNLIFNNTSYTSIKELKRLVNLTPETLYYGWQSFSENAILEGKNAEFYNNNESDNKMFFVGVISLLVGLIFVFSEIVWGMFIIIGIIFLCISRKIFAISKSKNMVYAVSFIVILLSLVLSFLNFSYNDIYHFSIWGNLICMCVSIGIIYMTTFIWKCRTIKGEEAYRKWKALKNFMENFGNMDEKELPEVHLWEQYLVYALVLGCADKLASAMELKLNEMGMIENVIHNIDYRDLLRINRVVSNSVHSSVRTATSLHNATYSSNRSTGGYFSRSSGRHSSGSGRGGGFSSGRGGGGGGGGRRF